MLDKLADFLVRYSAALVPGEWVCLSAPASAEPLTHAVRQAVLRQGGRLFPPAARDLDQVATADVAICIVGVEGPPLPSWAPLAQELFRCRCAGGRLRWVATPWPWTEELARAALLDQPDPAAAWQAQGKRQQRLLAALTTCRQLRIQTPAGTDLRLGVAGRTWINGQGHVNMPDGEVFTAPVASGTEGVVCFDFPSRIDGILVRGVRLTIQAGRVVQATAEQGGPQLQILLAQDAGARVLGEVGLGCNYALTQPTGHPLVDEKTGGTYHLALGAAYGQSGGNNRSCLHWDLVGDLRCGGRVEADGRLISRDGRFTDPAWPGP